MHIKVHREVPVTQSGWLNAKELIVRLGQLRFLVDAYIVLRLEPEGHLAENIKVNHLILVSNFLQQKLGTLLVVELVEVSKPQSFTTVGSLNYTISNMVEMVNLFI